MASRLTLTLLLWLVPLSWANAVVTIEITRGVERGIPLVVLPFAGAAEVAFDKIIHDDLSTTTQIDPQPLAEAKPPSHQSGGDSGPGIGSCPMPDIDFADWQSRQIEALVTGSIRRAGEAKYEICFRLFDVFTNRQLTGHKLTIPAAQLRRTAHQISDLVIEQLTGDPGPFTHSRLAYVREYEKEGALRYQLIISDYDGHNGRVILDSAAPLLSPSWSPDHRRLAYVSFQRGRASVFVQNIASGRRQALSTPGLSSAPVWSPDGRTMAMALSRDGNFEIYLFHLMDQTWQRLTRHTAIDTEPDFSPDGRHLVFTSDRSGRPQIYRVPASGGKAVQITRAGRYNARARYSPDGEQLALVTQHGGGFRIGLYSIATGALAVLTEGPSDEAPSFAPSGGALVYTRHIGRREGLALTVPGKPLRRAIVPDQVAYMPAWSGLNVNFQ